MYNQPTKVVDGRHVGLLYKNPIDCLWKTLKTEGPFGWYKGAYTPFITAISPPKQTFSRLDRAFLAYSAAHVRFSLLVA